MTQIQNVLEVLLIVGLFALITYVVRDTILRFHDRKPISRRVQAIKDEKLIAEHRLEIDKLEAASEVLKAKHAAMMEEAGRQHLELDAGPEEPETVVGYAHEVPPGLFSNPWEAS